MLCAAADLADGAHAQPHECVRVSGAMSFGPGSRSWCLDRPSGSGESSEKLTQGADLVGAEVGHTGSRSVSGLLYASAHDPFSNQTAPRGEPLRAGRYWTP